MRLYRKIITATMVILAILSLAYLFEDNFLLAGSYFFTYMFVGFIDNRADVHEHSMWLRSLKKED